MVIEKTRDIISPEKRDKLLSDMTLKRKEIVDFLKETLNRGVVISPEEVKDDVANKTYNFSLLKIKGNNRCLLQVPNEILIVDGSNSQDTFNAIDRVMMCFVTPYGRDLTLFIFHDAKPDLSFELNAMRWPDLTGVRAKFIELEKIEQLRKQTKSLQERYLARSLELDLSSEPVMEIKHKEVLRLAEIISDLPRWRDGPSDRRDWLEGIQEFSSWSRKFDFDGSDMVAAERLVGHLAILEDNSLGTLLNRILRGRSLPNKHRTYIMRFMKRYRIKVDG